MAYYKNIVRVSLYDKIWETAYNSDNDYGWKALDDESISVCRFEKDWITNLITVNDLEEINWRTPCMITSQTGSGKTTFIFKVCLALAKKERKKILYLCSRKALKSQIKEIAMKDSLNLYEKSDKCYVSEMKEYYSEIGIKKEHNFGLIDIYSYQDFLYLPEEEISEYSAVISDEAHFFLSDAGFNVYTEEMLDKLVRVMRNTRRIYLTATPEECMRVIYEKECSYAKDTFFYDENSCKVRMFIYLVDEDYSYLEPRFFTDMDEITEIIKREKNDKKWLVFIRSKELGKELKKNLGLPDGEVDYYDADTERKEALHYRELIQEEDLKARITITTKVFDVGINVKTENLNMVLFEDNPVELKQMVGRKRVKKQECVRVFFYVPNLSEMKKRMGSIKEQIRKEAEIINKARHSEYIVPEHPVYMTKKKGLCVNRLSGEKHMQDLYYCQDLIGLMDGAENQQDAANIYARNILGIFHLNYADSKKLIVDCKDAEGLDEKVRLCMSKWMSRDIEKGELGELSKQVGDIIGDSRADKRADRKHMGVNVLNKALEPYGYEIESLKGRSPVVYRVKLSEEGSINV